MMNPIPIKAIIACNERSMYVFALEQKYMPQANGVQGPRPVQQINPSN